MMYFFVIYYRTKDIISIRKIQKKFGFPMHMTVNGEWTVFLDGSDWPLFVETIKCGYVEIRNKRMSMKATELFKERIGIYLKREADAEPEFAKKMKEQPKKTTEAVCNFILREVSQSHRSGWADEEIYGMAKHFIDEESLTDPGDNNGVSRMVVDTHVELTDAQKQEALKQAKEAYEKKLEMEREKKLEMKKERDKKLREKKRQVKENEASMDLFGGMI